MPDRFGLPAVINSCAFYFAREAAGAAKRPAFPAPSVGRPDIRQNPDQIVSRECGCLTIESENARRA
jgi:hypothetical protein